MVPVLHGGRSWRTDWRVIEKPASRRDRRVALLLWLLPLWLLLSSAVGIWLHLRNRERAEETTLLRFSSGVAAADLADDVSKLTGFVGERHGDDATGARGLDRAAAMIEGTLGPSNAGYRVERVAGPSAPAGRWPILIAKVRGKDEDAPALWVVAGYDSRPGKPGAEANASGVASVMAAARAMAADLPERPVFFAFVPHVHRADEVKLATLRLLRDRAKDAGLVVVVEATGAAGELQASSRDAGSTVVAKLEGLAAVVGAEAVCLGEDELDLSAVLFELGLPAWRISTRAVVGVDEADDRAPDPVAHAAATTRLVELIRRLSDS
jgi:hypothetical protein